MALAADHWGPDNNACNEQTSTVAIVDCLDSRTKVWDARLNQVWKTLTTKLQNPSMKNRIDALKTAQRAWLQYRDANCGFYSTGEGTIRQIDVAMCMHDMTQSRAIELQGIGPQ